MTKETKRNIFLILIAIVITIAIIGYGTWNRPHLNVENATAIKTTAIGLYSGLSKNDTISKSIYLNKVVEVSGVINQVSLNQQNQQIILLMTNVSGGSVNFKM